MPEQEIIATQQRRNILLDAVKRLSRTGQWVTQPELAREMRNLGYSVEKHHVQRDLRALVKIHQQLECEDFSDDGERRRGKTYQYRWYGKDAPPETGLTLPEALSLVLVQRHLRQALPVTLTKALDSLFARAEATLDLQKSNSAAAWPNLAYVVVPTQPLLPARIDEDVLKLVHEAILRREQILVRYRNARNRRDELLLHPLGMMLRGPNAYLVALCADFEDVRLYALQRLESAKRTEMPSRHPESFDLALYVEQQGHFGSGEMISLRLRVAPYLAGILAETPLSEDQKIGNENRSGWRTVTASVRETWQLRWWILSCAGELEVMAPRRLRQEIGQTLVEASQPYRRSATGAQAQVMSTVE